MTKSLALVSITSLLLFTGCVDASAEGGPSAETLVGIGASSQQVAMQTWIAGFQSANEEITINYSPEGSGNGRKAFLSGGADFAGSDRAFKLNDTENKAGNFDAKCAAGTTALDLPLYISPIAVIYNVPGVTNLNLDAATAAGIFKGEIKNWQDPKIAQLNPGVELPDLRVSVVHRSDDSGTTHNFTDYLWQTSGGVWDSEPDGEWPHPYRAEAAKGTAGVISAVKIGNGTIGYADAGQTTDMQVAKLGSKDKFYPPTAQAAAAIVENSPRNPGRAEYDLAIDLDRKADGYPVVLVSYLIVCQEYNDPKTGKLVKAFAQYAASEGGQQAAAKRSGSAPLGPKLSKAIQDAIAKIK
ncbi:MAG: phosphate ABC transporter substrate-binding protein PstS [Propionibacterium sp.]|nr:MAG: phosphate ABC transporter substrate-binding protein PstS [Propionibacterium sp.]